MKKNKGDKSMMTKKRVNMTEANPNNFEGFQKARKKPIIIFVLQVNFEEGFVVNTLEGKMHGAQGDYLAVGAMNEKYIIKKEIFDKTYDIISEGE
jgi:hypothetical protein